MDHLHKSLKGEYNTGMELRKYTLSLLTSFTLVIFLILSCSSGSKKVYDSGKNLSKVKQARVAYFAKNYESAAFQLKALLDEGITSGDIYFYYGHALDVNAGGKEFSPEAQKYFELATNWFSTYLSEFPEDQNDEKAYYDLGELYYRVSKNQDLALVKVIWDEGLKKNSNNPFIKANYPLLFLQIDYLKHEKTAVLFQEKLLAASQVSEVEAIASQFSKVLKNTDLEEYKKKQIVPSELLTAVSKNFDKVIEERKKELTTK